MTSQTQKRTFPVENKEHYRRVMILLERKTGIDEMRRVFSQQKLIALKEAFVTVLELSELQTESLIQTYDRIKHPDFRLNKFAAQSGMEKIRQASALEKLADYVDEWMGLGSKEEARKKFLRLFSEQTDYGYSGWRD
jgi:hypothetical protein